MQEEKKITKETIYFELKRIGRGRSAYLIETDCEAIWKPAPHLLLWLIFWNGRQFWIFLDFLVIKRIIKVFVFAKKIELLFQRNIFDFDALEKVFWDSLAD